MQWIWGCRCSFKILISVNFFLYIWVHFLCITCLLFELCRLLVSGGDGEGQVLVALYPCTCSSSLACMSMFLALAFYPESFSTAIMSRCINPTCTNDNICFFLGTLASAVGCSSWAHSWIYMVQRMRHQPGFPKTKRGSASNQLWDPLQVSDIPGLTVLDCKMGSLHQRTSTVPPSSNLLRGYWFFWRIVIGK